MIGWNKEEKFPRQYDITENDDENVVRKLWKEFSQMKKKNGFKKYLSALPPRGCSHVYIIKKYRTFLSHFNFVHTEKRWRHVPTNSSSCVVPRFPACYTTFYPWKTLNLIVTNLLRRNLYFYWPDWTFSSVVFRSRDATFISWCCLLLLVSTLRLIAFL